MEGKCYNLKFDRTIVQQLRPAERQAYSRALVVNCGCDRTEADSIVSGEKIMEMHGDVWEKSELGQAFFKANTLCGGVPYELPEVKRPRNGSDETTLCYW